MQGGGDKDGTAGDLQEKRRADENPVHKRAGPAEERNLIAEHQRDNGDIGRDDKETLQIPIIFSGYERKAEEHIGHRLRAGQGDGLSHRRRVRENRIRRQGRIQRRQGGQRNAQDVRGDKAIRAGGGDNRIRPDTQRHIQEDRRSQELRQIPGRTESRRLH